MDINHASQSVKIAQRWLLLQMHKKGGQGARGGQDLCLQGKTWPWVSAACQQSIFSITLRIHKHYISARGPWTNSGVRTDTKTQIILVYSMFFFQKIQKLKLVLRATAECERFVKAALGFLTNLWDWSEWAIVLNNSAFCNKCAMYDFFFSAHVVYYKHWTLYRHSAQNIKQPSNLTDSKF